MAIPHKPGVVGAITLVGQIPEVPKLPNQTIHRFPELDLYSIQMQEWWNRFSVMLQRDLDAIEARFKADEILIASLQTEVATLTSRLDALSP